MNLQFNSCLVFFHNKLYEVYYLKYTHINQRKVTSYKMSNLLVYRKINQDRKTRIRVTRRVAKFNRGEWNPRFDCSK